MHMSKPSNTRSNFSPPAAKGLDDHIAVRVARITEIVTRIATRTIEARWGLTNTDLRLLNILDGAEPMAISEISRRSHVDKAWVSRSLRDLERRKLVVRRNHPKDTRVSLVSISTLGQAQLNQVRPQSLRNEIALLKGIDARLLKRLLDDLEGNAGTVLEQLDVAADRPVK